MIDYKKGLGYTLPGTGPAILIHQPVAFGDDPFSDPIAVPGFSFSATATNTASPTTSSVQITEVFSG
jgi:hypothetical protein